MILKKILNLMQFCFNSWLNYLRKNNSELLLYGQKWKMNNFKHPIQKDESSCDVYCVLFIEHYITKQKKIDFKHDKQDLMAYRKNINDLLASNSFTIQLNM